VGDSKFPSSDLNTAHSKLLEQISSGRKKLLIFSLMGDLSLFPNKLGQGRYFV
jgi:hypothetical protein